MIIISDDTENQLTRQLRRQKDIFIGDQTAKAISRIRTGGRVGQGKEREEHNGRKASRFYMGICFDTDSLD